MYCLSYKNPVHGNVKIKMYINRCIGNNKYNKLIENLMLKLSIRLISKSLFREKYTYLDRDNECGKQRKIKNCETRQNCLYYTVSLFV